MKKIFLFAVLMILGAALIAQSPKYSNPKHLKGQAVPAVAIDNPVLPQQTGNFLAISKSTLEDIIGETRYDAQSTAGIQNRLIVWPDGSISAAWTKAQLETAFTDRGTGYNYFNGATWGPAPAQRIETIRTGWPSMDKWNGNGEIVISHQSGMTQLVMCTRPVKGTGAWTQSLIATPPPATGLLWPRIMTSGTNNNYVHMLVVTTPTGNGGAVYNGLDGALLYYRSLNGGVTWDKTAVILPGLDEANYDAFSADHYAWGTPHGDTIYFGVAGQWLDSFIMKSTNNGETWIKIPVLTNANKKLPAGTTEVSPFYSGDGAVAVEMDHSGVIHMAFGKGGGYMSAGTRYIYVNQNGLIYWNTTMPMVQDSLDLDILETNGNLLAYVFDGPNPGDTIIAAPIYRVGLSSHPQLSIDANNNLYCLYSAVTPGNPSPDPYNYRHMWGRARFHSTGAWGDMTDFNEGIFYIFQEFAFPNMAKQALNNKLHVIYQTSSQPGSAIQDATIPIHDNNYEHRVIPLSAFGNPPANNPTLAISTLQNVAAGPVSVPVHASNFNNLGAFQFTLEYNPALMTYTGCSNWYPGLTDVLIGSGTPGKITFIWAASSQGVNLPDGNFFNINFTWLGSSGTSPVSWTDSPTPREFSDYNGLIFAPTYTNGGVTGTQPATHFIPVWTGNPLNPMAIGVTQARLDLVDLVAGDEIGVFDGEYCVGVYKLTAPIDPVNPPFITVSKDDPEIAGINGYTEGNTIIYKLWKNSTSSEISSITHTFPFAPNFVFETFTQNETAVVILSGSSVPINTPVQNVSIPDGVSKCYNATQTITVAGNGTTFLVENGGSATMIAGQNILFLPGTTVQSGGYLLGYIAPNGPYCVNPSMPAVVTGEAEMPTSAELSLFRIYPNPTPGDFILEFKGVIPDEDIRVNIFGMQGENLLDETTNGKRIHTISLTDKPAGIYFIRVIRGNNIETMKLIKL